MTITPKKNFYDVDGFLYRRVTSILDVVNYGTSEASAFMAGEGVALDASNVLSGESGFDSATDFVTYLATTDVKYYTGRYFRMLGERADRGTLVDLAFQEIVTHGPFRRKDAEEWAFNEKQAHDTVRELTNAEYKQAKEQELWMMVEELRDKPMYPMTCDLDDVVDRIMVMQEFLDDFFTDNELVSIQGFVKCDRRRIAGTYDAVFQNKDGEKILLDVKATRQVFGKHADQMAAYDDLGCGFDKWAILQLRPDDKGRMKSWYREVKDKEIPRKRWTFAQALHGMINENVFTRAKTKEMQAV